MSLFEFSDNEDPTEEETIEDLKDQLEFQWKFYNKNLHDEFASKGFDSHLGFLIYQFMRLGCAIDTIDIPMRHAVREALNNPNEEED